jgi:hypothetical protein
MSRGRRDTSDIFIKGCVKGCVLEHQMVKFAKMILRDRRSTFHDLASLCGRRNALDRWSGKITKDIGAIGSALDFPFLKEVSQNCFVLMLSSSKIEEVSQNCCGFDVVNFQI